MSRENYAYISVTQWPDGFPPERQVAALSQCIGLDPFHARQRIAKGTPMVVAKLATGGPAESAGAALRQHGATVFSPSDSALIRLGSPRQAKRLVPGVGGTSEILFDMWREAARVVRLADVFLIVRGRIRIVEHGAAQVDMAIEPTYGALPGTGVMPEFHVSHSRNTRLRDVVDIFLRDGSWLRIDSAKFNFDMLGRARGYSDHENTDKLCLALARASPRALLDTSFDQFNCPPQLIRGAGATRSRTGVVRRDDSPLFDFYSAWSCLLYQDMLADSTA